jgi:intracellular multiplication protein IcmD
MTQRKKIILAMALFSIAGFVFAGGNDPATLGSIADNIRKNLAALVNLVYGVAGFVGVLFLLTGIVKFKAHRESPTQVPMTAPLVLIGIGAALLFLPTLTGVAGQSIFGDSKVATDKALDDSNAKGLIFKQGGSSS